MWSPSFIVVLIVLGSSWHMLAAISLPTCDIGLLRKGIHTLNRALDYMAKHVAEINLDGVWGVRLCADQFRGFLSSIESFNVPQDIVEKLAYLSTLADNTAKSSIPYLKESDPSYYKSIGLLLTPAKWEMSYGLRQLNHSLLDPSPMSCSEWSFLESQSDACFRDLSKKCHITKKCLKYMTGSGSKDYGLTHEVLYLLVAEAFGCVKEVLRHTSTDLKTRQDSLCINVLRDAENIQKLDYPIEYRDLLFEQIGVCGIFGYTDFLKEQWMEKSIEWQEPSGCYMHQKKYKCRDNLENENVRRKREDRKLKDNCSSHTTAVAIFALTTEIQLCIRTILEHYSTIH